MRTTSTRSTPGRTAAGNGNAQVVGDLAAWGEYPYRVRPRTSDEPETLTKLADAGHALQARLACHEAWAVADDAVVGQAFLTAREQLADIVGPASNEAWALSPITDANGMNLGDWGPGPEVHRILSPLEEAIQNRTHDRWFR